MKQPYGPNKTDGDGIAWIILGVALVLAVGISLIHG